MRERREQAEALFTEGLAPTQHSEHVALVQHDADGGQGEGFDAGLGGRRAVHEDVLEPRAAGSRAAGGLRLGYVGSPLTVASSAL
jgi:hypothetical protein